MANEMRMQMWIGEVHKPFPSDGVRALPKAACFTDVAARSILQRAAGTIPAIARLFRLLFRLLFPRLSPPRRLRRRRAGRRWPGLAAGHTPGATVVHERAAPARPTLPRILRIGIRLRPRRLVATQLTPLAQTARRQVVVSAVATAPLPQTVHAAQRALRTRLARRLLGHVATPEAGTAAQLVKRAVVLEDLAAALGTLVHRRRIHHLSGHSAASSASQGVTKLWERLGKNLWRPGSAFRAERRRSARGNFRKRASCGGKRRS
mmetsp:Transcript_10096/g.38240  ORF Transcript_10096/g.38240 Transcript_10096/m.38240 type:complete len:263 (-) Transcript_10096:122-910(-)